MEHHTPITAAARRILAALDDDTAVFVLIDSLVEGRAGWLAARAIGEF